MALILSERSALVLGKGYITKGALDTRWCHYQTKYPLNSAFPYRSCTDLARNARALCCPH
jgi:hypothetical protein